MSDEVRGLFEASVQASGGAALWSRLTGLRFTMRARGLLLAVRGISPSWRHYTVEISTREARTVLSPFGTASGRGVYTDDAVRIESLDGGLIAERHGARAHARDHIFWDKLDLLYLLGYSFWNYHNVPFLFLRDGFHAVELDPWRDASTGQLLRRVQVRFPPDVPSHCSEQLYYFDERALIVRLDYGADVFNPRRRGAHLCTEYRAWSGLMIPSHRRAVPYWIGGRPMHWLPSLMEACIDEVELLFSEN